MSAYTKRFLLRKGRESISAQVLLLLVLVISAHGNVGAESYRSAHSIQQDIETLSAQVATLPELVLSPTPWTLGYRSPFKWPSNKLLHIDLNFVTPATIDLIALVPTSYTSNLGKVAAFGFPERFTIARLLADGSSEVIVDYSNRDYLVTGIEPQLFHLAAPAFAEGIRVTIIRQGKNSTWWPGENITTLSEIFVFSGASNIALGAAVAAPAVNSFGYVWHPDCLVDGFSLFSPIRRKLRSPVTTVYHTDEKSVLLFDLGEMRSVDELRIWPVVHSAQHNYPLSSGIGFPTQIRFEQLSCPKAGIGKLLYDSGDNLPKPGSSPLMLRLNESKGRYFKLTLQQPVPDFRYHQRISIALSEIEILEKGALLQVKLSTEETSDGLNSLTDGRTSEGTIVPLRAWVEGLTLRATLDRRMYILQQNLRFSQRQESERLKFYIVTALGIIALLVTFIWLIQLLAERRWHRVRDRIACDLHDEIGANASSLVHMTELIKETIPHPTTIQYSMLEEAIYTARITSRETRNFVQFLESEKSNFDINFQIGKIAQQLLGNTSYTCSLDVSKPLKKLNSSEQWDLLMFVKEALNNIAKHAQASHIDILTYLRDGRIELSISDNGKGIPQNNLPPRHLELRAKRLRAELVVEPLTETGTHIRLTLRK